MSESECLQCAAARNLTPEDWAVIDFFGHVQDQTVNLTPMGTKDGVAVISPRIEGWLAVAEIQDVPLHDRADVIDDARLVFEAVHGRYTDGEVFYLPLEALRPPVLAVA